MRSHVALAALLLTVPACQRSRSPQVHSLSAPHLISTPRLSVARPLPTFLSEVSAQRYQLLFSPAAIPLDVHAALELALGSPLNMAAPSEPFNETCLFNGRAMTRLLCAAVSKHYAVVHYQHGGYAPGSQAFVFGRSNHRATLLWSQLTTSRLHDPAVFQEALRSGALWRPETGEPGAGA